MGLLAVCGRVHDETVEFFDAPTVIHKFGRQPVEQIGMRRQFRACAEVFRRLEQARAEVTLPDAIHERARSRRRFFVHQPVCQREARAIGIRRERMQECGCAGLHHVTGLEEITALEKSRFAHLITCCERQLRLAVRPLRPELFDLVVGFLELR